MGVLGTVVGAVKGFLGVGSDDADAPLPPDPVKIAKYFLGLVETGEVLPEEEWDEARLAYEGESKKGSRPVTNRWRMRVDTQAAFLDEEPARVVVKARKPFADNPIAKKTAECDQEVLAWLCEEQGLRPEFGRWRHSADTSGLGWLLFSTDYRTSLPQAQQIENENVRWDADCNGNLTRAGWLAYFQMEAPEEVWKRNPELDLQKLKKAAVKPKDSPDAKELSGEALMKRSKGKEVAGESQAKCKVWHIFARGVYALYDKEPLVADKPHIERYRDRKGMREARRHIEVVEGFDGTIKDEDDWPAGLGLGYDEWPVLRLAYQEAFNRAAGFSDFRHEQKCLELYERAVGGAARWMEGIYKILFGTRSGCKLTDEQVKEIMSSPDRMVMPGMVDERGEPMIVAIETGKYNAAMEQWPDQLKAIHEETSGLPKVKMAEESDQTATAERIQADAASARSNVRLRAWENALAEGQWRLLVMCHVILPKWSIVEDAAGQVQPPMPWAQAEQVLIAGGDLVQLGVDAMVGPELAQYWQEHLPLDVLRLRLNVEIEHGSTQRAQRQEKIGTFIATYRMMIQPVLAALGPLGMEKQIEAARKVLAMQDLGEFESILPDAQSLIPPAPVVGPPGGAETVSAPAAQQAVPVPAGAP